MNQGSDSSSETKLENQSHVETYIKATADLGDSFEKLMVSSLVWFSPVSHFLAAGIAAVVGHPR